MTEWKDVGLIFRTGHFHESNLWVKIFLRAHGLVTVFAFGGARSRKRFSGCLDTLNILDCRITHSRTKEYHVLEEASLVSSPHMLRSNYPRLGILSNCLKFAEAVSISPDLAPDCYDLVINLRNCLEEREPLLCQFFFRLKLAGILGFKPDFEHCAACGKIFPESAFFIPRDGIILCDTCSRFMDREKRRQALPVSHWAAKRLDAVQRTLPYTWPESGLHDETARQCGRIVDAFIQYHLGLDWNDGCFRRF